MTGASMGRPTVSVDMLRAKIAASCECGKWTKEVQLTSGKKTSQVLEEIDAAFREHQKTCPASTPDATEQRTLHSPRT